MLFGFLDLIMITKVEMTNGSVLGNLSIYVFSYTLFYIDLLTLHDPLHII